MLAAVDYITPNETELGILTGLPTNTDEEVLAAAKELVRSGVKNIVATLGSRGALIANAAGCERIAGYKVKAVDTVAAGDSFNGALAVALTEGETLEQAVRFANAMGALTVQKKGAIHCRADEHHTRSSGPLRPLHAELCGCQIPHHTEPDP